MTDKMNLRFKENLAHHMERNGYTQSQLARLAGIPKSSLNNWIAGVECSSFIAVKKLADAFKISMEHLLFGNGDTSPSSDVPIPQSSAIPDWQAGVYEVRFRKISGGAL